MGPCGKIVVNSSDWHGLARCPGLVSNDATKADWSNMYNREFMYVSMNMRNTFYATGVRAEFSIIERFRYGSPKDNAPYIEDAEAETVITLTSNISAGPLLIDKAMDYVYFVDQNPEAPFIGRFEITYNVSSDLELYETWLALSEPVVGFTMDAHFAPGRRRIYWSHTGLFGLADGKIMYASLDADPAVAVDITATIGQANVVNPGGMAVHVPRQRLFWIDRDTSDIEFNSVLRSSDLDGGDLLTIFLYRYLLCCFIILLLRLKGILNILTNIT
jgi:hypothetical protein